MQSNFGTGTDLKFRYSSFDKSIFTSLDVEPKFAKSLTNEKLLKEKLCKTLFNCLIMNQL